MNPSVKTKDLVDALKIRSAEQTAYINLLTGRVIRLDTALVAALKSRKPPGEALTAEQIQALEEARAIVGDPAKRFLPAPKPEDFPEYKTVQSFIVSLQDRTVAFELHQAIKSRGAFRQFKAALAHFGLGDAWLEFREQAMVEFVLQWAKRHHLTCVATVVRRRI